MSKRNWLAVLSAAALATAGLMAATAPGNAQTTPQIVRVPHTFWSAGTSEDAAWATAQRINSVEAYEAFMRDYPTSRHFNAARDRRRELLALREPTRKRDVDRGVIIRPPPPIPPPPAPPPPPPVQQPKIIMPPAPNEPPPAPPSRAPETTDQGEIKTRTFEMRKAEEKAESAPGPGPGTGAGPGTGSGPGSAAPLPTVITAAMTDLMPNEDRRAQNGGAAMVLLTNSPAQQARNAALCRALYTDLTTATTNEIAVGARRVDGVIQILRPVYWFVRSNRQATSVKAEGCPTRLSTYHFARAGAVMRNVGLSGEGPFLAVVRTDDRAAGVIDLSRASETEIGQWVRYFRDSYSRRDRIWSPQNNAPEAARRDMVAYFGETVARALTTAPRAVFR